MHLYYLEGFGGGSGGGGLGGSGGGGPGGGLFQKDKDTKASVHAHQLPFFKMSSQYKVV